MPEQTPDATFMALHLTVNNHPGVMSHVCGLFARRAFNVEGILVTPLPGGATASMWLLVNSDERLDQMVKQVEKLHDVLAIQVTGIHGSAFDRLTACMHELSADKALEAKAGV